MNKLLKFVSLLLSVTLIFCICGCASDDYFETTGKDPEKKIGTHHAVISVEAYGNIYLELYGDIAPITVQNFMDLANSGFYNGLTFYAISENFFIQAGDPACVGIEESTAESIVGEFSMNGYKNGISHKKGVISMVLDGNKPNSATSMFQIVLGDELGKSFNGNHAAFGRVTDGMSVIERMVKTIPITNKLTCEITASQQPVIKSITILD